MALCPNPQQNKMHQKVFHTYKAVGTHRTAAPVSPKVPFLREPTPVQLGTQLTWSGLLEWSTHQLLSIDFGHFVNQLLHKLNNSKTKHFYFSPLQN
ncbi:hypothetical protein XELAEV_18010663mg [Xenopus laevis]|uniref:Uncharacterized protein n=1 Tax=Xenopus laevis TaxID=8355 RepID=A0A974I260_XENLA|nr:hypothetical protein XELAEV_18010663mg [Xenopus laevis]